MQASGGPTTPAQLALIDATCGPAEPNLATNTNAGPPVPTKPCGIDVTQCAQDVKSCLAKAQKLDADAAAQLGYVYMNGLGVAADSQPREELVKRRVDHGQCSRPGHPG